MGDRLISANKLKNHYAWWDDEKKEIFDTIVDLQPTAYDIDKVVEQLEENWEIVRGNYAIERNGYYGGKMDAYDRAIEIVRKGGAV